MLPYEGGLQSRVKKQTVIRPRYARGGSQEWRLKLSSQKQVDRQVSKVAAPCI
jgi:hypothetical protein